MNSGRVSNLTGTGRGSAGGGITASAGDLDTLCSLMTLGGVGGMGGEGGGATDTCLMIGFRGLCVLGREPFLGVTTFSSGSSCQGNKTVLQ